MRYYSILVSLLLSLLSPMQAVAAGTVLVDSKGPVEQDFVLTAYYSPLPDQCCYIKGSYEADKILNGEGTNGADGTPVYAGMLAAPPSYAFGTRIELPGLGILTVHDRGGAIQEWDHAHRLDVWAGAGEEGLARALAFGVQHIRGKVYAPGTPMPSESVSLADLPAPLKRLEPYTVSDAGVASTNAVVPAKKAALPIDTLQERLAILGYFQHPVTGIYGDITRTAVATFINDIGIQDTVETVVLTRE